MPLRVGEGTSAAQFVFSSIKGCERGFASCDNASGFLLKSYQRFIHRVGDLGEDRVVIQHLVIKRLK